MFRCMNNALASILTAELISYRRDIKINDELLEFRGDRNVWVEEAVCTILSTRGSVCWVVLSGDVSCMSIESVLFYDTVNTFKYNVC